ncbi:MAG: DNA cytosine methyltransferase [Patescibacteria group bacterium]
MKRIDSDITVTDQFCGAGGSSQGVRNLSRKPGNSGIRVKLALNHWKLAIETHNTNFPDTDHDCTDISACDPRRYASSTFLITSPECTNHSLAKGIKRKWQQQIEMFGRATIDHTDERSRATMWDVPRFAEFHQYAFIIVENVVDARYWVMWDAWLKAMHLLGYNHKCVYLNSQHAHPTPQSRDRMYVVFWKKGNPAPDLNIRPRGFCQHCAKETETYQAWKTTEKQWGKYKQQYVFKCPTCNHLVEPYYYAAFNCIDWSIPGTRIGDRKKPLSENTVKRIQYGIEKYWNKPQIITTRYTSGISCRVKDATQEVLPTQPGDQSYGILNPIIVKRNHNTLPGSLVKDSVKDPLPTQLTDNGFHILSPLVTNGEYSNGRNKIRDAASEVAFTQTTRATNGVVMPPLIVDLHRTGKARLATKPLSTITAGFIKNGIVTDKSLKSFLSYYYGGTQASDVNEPVRTLTTKDRASLVMLGAKPKIDDCYYRMLLKHEVKIGMGFDADYIVLGNAKEQVKQCGNAVTPPAMELLVERCVDTLR